MRKNVTHQAIIVLMKQDSNNSTTQTGTGKQQSIAGSAREALSGRMNQAVSGIAAAGAANTVGPDNSGNTIVVQYNPKSIQYAASAQDTQANAAAGVGIPKAITVGCSTTMSIELLFHSQGPEDDSVRKQMDMLLTLMSQSKDRQVLFAWGTMTIKGAVTSFSFSYDMFNRAGKPISAKVNMSIRSQAGIEDKQYTELAKERSGKEERG